MLTLMRIAATNLTRDRVAQALTFLLPIIFFSIFATVFGRQGSPETTRIRVAVVDEDQSELSRRVVEGLRKESGLRVRTAPEDEKAAPPLDRAGAERLVRSGDVPIAVVIPRGLGEAFGRTGFGGGPPIALLADPSDPVAPNMVGGLLQKVAMTAAPDLMMQGGIRQFETHAGQLTPQQKAAVEAWLPMLKSGAGSGGASASPGGGASAMGVNLQVVDVMRSGDQRASLVSFYAAGIGVMFLLFSMVGAAGGVLLEEVESGTLERLLCTRIGMSGILGGKWLFLVVVGFAQLSVMFLWGTRRVWFAALFASRWLCGHDAGHVGSGGGPRADAGHRGQVASAALGLFDDPHPDHVGARRQHVSALSDERDDAARRAGHVQRVGARRLPESLLAQCRRSGSCGRRWRCLWV